MNMKFWNAGGGKPEDLIHVVKNLETITIPAGAPVVYAFNGTDDGLGVVLPSSSSAAKSTNFCAGVTVKEIPAGKLENVQVYGFHRKTLIARATRANSTTPWPTMASVEMGAILGIDTALNGFISTAAAAASAFQPFAVAAELVAAGPTLASSNNGMNAASATVYHQGIKAFLRFM